MSESLTVTALSVTPVKGTRIRRVDSVELTRAGAVGDRRFFIVDERDRMVNAKQLGRLQTVCAEWDPASRRLALVFPDGRRVEEIVRLGEPLTTRFYSSPREERLVEGPWAAALSEHVGVALRLVETETGVDRGATGAASLISAASLKRLAAEAEPPIDELDARRFRMLIEFDGVEAHAEDAWVGRRIAVGEAELRVEGHVGRCLITGRDPETGISNLPTLDMLGYYRLGADTTEPLAFGVYGQVTREGIVRVGDALSVDDALSVE